MVKKLRISPISSKLAVFIISSFLTFAIFIPCGAQDARPAVVIITAGQSNTDGRVDNSELPDSIRTCGGYRHCRWCYGSEGKIQTFVFEPFWPRIARSHPDRWGYDAIVYHRLEGRLDRDFYVIKWSLGGTAIDTANTSTGGKYWLADPGWLSQSKSTMSGGKSLLLSLTQEIDTCIDRYLSLLPYGYEVKAFLWHQGEGDRGAGGRYYDNLKALVSHVRNHLVGKTGNASYARLPFICGTVSRKSRQYNSDVEEALWRLSREEENFHVVDMSDGELQRDRLHFTAESAVRLGEKMFDCLDQYLGGENF